MSGHLDLVDHAIERRTQVHEGQGLRLERLQELGRVGQGLTDPGSPEDRHTVTGHLPQARGPLPGIALYLLRVAGVGHGPDEQIAGVKDPALRYPYPRRVL